MAAEDVLVRKLSLYKFLGGLAFALIAAGFTAAMFLFTHYAAASDVEALKKTSAEHSEKLSAHDALIRDLHDDVKYIRDAVDDLRNRSRR